MTNSSVANKTAATITVNLSDWLGGKPTVIPANTIFHFEKLCPYCGEDLYYTAEGWEQEDDGTWTANSLSPECVSEPPIDSDDWEDWFSSHSDMPYVYQMPVDNQVQEYINRHYRFQME